MTRWTSGRAMPRQRPGTSVQEGWMQRALEAESRVQALEAALIRLRDCDWIITPADRMDAVREIARAALEKQNG